MPGTYSGGVKAAKTNKERYGEDFYVKIGAKGGAKSRGGGFASSHERAVEAGRKGGKAKRRTIKQQVEAEAKQTEKEHSLWKRLKNL